MDDELKEGPIPANIIEEIFSIAEKEIQEELQQQSELQQISEEGITGLEVGYFAPPEGSQELGEAYYLRRGKVPPVEILPEDEDESNEDEIEPDPDENLLSDEFVDQLIARLQAEVVERTPPDVLKGYNVRMYLVGTYAYNNNNQCCYGYWCCPKFNGEWGHQRYRCNCTVTRCRGRC